ncbi:hypothetical protein M0804_003848 [Polistes exclamans]|nr:hypothetical protein M0804_003848 [Polistes exclamans]
MDIPCQVWGTCPFKTKDQRPKIQSLNKVLPLRSHLKMIEKEEQQNALSVSRFESWDLPGSRIWARLLELCTASNANAFRCKRNDESSLGFNAATLRTNVQSPPATNQSYYREDAANRVLVITKNKKSRRRIRKKKEAEVEADEEEEEANEEEEEEEEEEADEDEDEE